jgi:hypothetical protein
MLAERPERLALSAEIDFRKAFADAQNPPRVTLIYGALNWDDRIQAEYLAGLPNVSLRAIPDLQGHNAVTALIRRNELQEVLDELVSPQPSVNS